MVSAVGTGGCPQASLALFVFCTADTQALGPLEGVCPPIDSVVESGKAVAQLKASAQGV